MWQWKVLWKHWNVKIFLSQKIEKIKFPMSKKLVQFFTLSCKTKQKKSSTRTLSKWTQIFLSLLLILTFVCGVLCVSCFYQNIKIMFTKNNPNKLNWISYQKIDFLVPLFVIFLWNWNGRGCLDVDNCFLVSEDLFNSTLLQILITSFL